MISVIITNHDAYTERLLTRALPSVLNQSFTDFEVIVVQDGGENIKDKLPKDDRIVYLHRKENFGNHTRPKNDGTLKAKGEYIAYLDADNAYRKDHLQALYRAIKNNDVVYGDRWVIDEDDNFPAQLATETSEFSLSLLAKGNYIDTSDVLCKKETVLAVGGWDESLPYFADYNLWVRMAKNGAKFKRVPLIITDYYVHSENNVKKSQVAVEKYEKGLLDPDPSVREKAADMVRGFSVQNCKIWPDKTIMGDRPKTRVGIYTLTMNRLPYTQTTFETMRKTTKHPFDHFVLDQGSSDKTWTWLCDKEKEYGLKIFTENKNLGISKGSNYLLDKMKDYDIIIKVDNDLEFLTNNWLESIVEIYESTRGMVLSPYIEGLIDHPGGWPRVRDGFIGRHYVGITEHLGGACIAAPARAYENFRWEDDDFLHGEQDWLFSMHCRDAGFVLAYLENIRVEHMFNTSLLAKGKTEADQKYLDDRKKEKVTKYEG